MTPSTTNTAAREVVPAEMMERLADAAAALDKFGRRDQCRDLMHLHEHLSTLTQQQGGEQEAGVLVGRWRRLASYEDEEGELEVGSESAVRLIRCADELEAALRSKQAAGEAVVVTTTGHCEARKQPGGCPHHNLHCGWPKCDQRTTTTPPRHPADEGAVCAEDLRWLDDIAADLKQAGGSTNNMRLIALNRALAALAHAP